MVNVGYKTILPIFMWIYQFVVNINGHGRLVDPPGRSSMWRYGYNTPVNYNDNQLFCGGYNVQHFLHGGKCGVCGDEYGAPQLNQPPGPFATGIITRSYFMNSNITMYFEITASHRGYLEFRICPNNDVTKPVTQECLDQYLLSDVVTGGTKFYFNYATVGLFPAEVSLPPGLTCSQCVIQWRYHTGNSWGCVDDDITKDCGIGLGRQEEFYACADVEIVTLSGNGNATPVTQSTTTSSTSSTKQPTTSSFTSSSNPVSFSKLSTLSSTSATSASTSTPTTSVKTSEIPTYCFAIGAFKGDSNMDQWCQTNCKAGYCPSTHCSVSCNGTQSSTKALTLTTQSTTSRSTAVLTTSSTKTTPSSITSLSTNSRCPPLDQYARNPSIVDWCINSCIFNYCSPFLCKCVSTSTQSTSTKSLTTATTLSTSDLPPTNSFVCRGAGAWTHDTAMATWCQINCALGHCPPSTCQCSNSGTIQELSYGLGDKCITVMENISDRYRMFMDLWCKHNCPTFGCWNIPHICKC